MNRENIIPERIKLIKDYRSRGLSYEDIAKLMGVSKQYVYSLSRDIPGIVKERANKNEKVMVPCARVGCHEKFERYVDGVKKYCSKDCFRLAFPKLSDEERTKRKMEYRKVWWTKKRKDANYQRQIEIAKSGFAQKLACLSKAMPMTVKERNWFVKAYKVEFKRPFWSSKTFAKMWRREKGE